MENLQEAIFDKAAELFCAYGLKSVSMDDVARQMGMSKKTIYQHVKDKKELIEKALDQFKLKSMQKIISAANLQLDAIEQMLMVNKMIREVIFKFNPVLDRDMKKYYPDMECRMRSRHDEMAKDMARKNLALGLKQGLFRPDINVELVVILQYGRIMQLMSLNEEELPLPWDEAIWQTMDYHLRGICTPKGLELLEKYTPKYKVTNAPKSHQ